jgi:methylglutamate dehydrogenase subunit B
MRIPCVYCGERGHEEFSYLGDATIQRPSPGATPDAWHDYGYLRDNPSGHHRELWHHVLGCRAWLVITRDTRTHAILSVEAAQDVAPSREKATP